MKLYSLATTLAIVVGATACTANDPLKYRVTPQMANAVAAEKAPTAKRLADKIFQSDRKRKLARAQVRVALLRERMSEYLLRVAAIRVEVIGGRALMVRHGYRIQATGQDLLVARKELALAKVNRRYRRVNSEFARRRVTHAEAAYQHNRARHFEFVMESLNAVGHRSTTGRRMSDYIRQTGDRKMIMASGLRAMERRKREVTKLRSRVAGRWSPALVCPTRDVTRSSGPRSMLQR